MIKQNLKVQPYQNSQYTTMSRYSCEPKTASFSFRHVAMDFQAAMDFTISELRMLTTAKNIAITTTGTCMYRVVSPPLQWSGGLIEQLIPKGSKNMRPPTVPLILEKICKKKKNYELCCAMPLDFHFRNEVSESHCELPL